ncbi:MAG: hypothetical protein WBG19_08180, partial [Thermoplasmata archaeon]
MEEWKVLRMGTSGSSLTRGMDWLRLGLVAAANAPQSAVSATMAPLDETAGIALAAAGAAAAA